MAVLRLVLHVVFILPAAVWLGGLVMMVIAARVVRGELAGRRTDAGHIVQRLRGLFQRMELVLLGLVWASVLAHLLLMGLAKSYGGQWRAAEAIQLAMLVLATALTVLASWGLAPRLRRDEARIGTYAADKDAQVKVRKRAAVLHRWLELLGGAVAVAVAVMLVAAVLSAGTPARPAATDQPTTAPASRPAVSPATAPESLPAR